MCLRPTHHLIGAYAGAGATYLAHGPVWQVAAAAGIAAVAAPGPDVDQHGWWRRLDRWVPDEWLGHGGPLGHRRLSHFWGLPAVALCVAFIAVPAGYRWIAYAAIAGWVSHLLADAIWGRACPMDGRGPGVPVWPWWGHHGIGLDTGGRLESLARWVLSVAWLAPAWACAAPQIHTVWEAIR